MRLSGWIALLSFSSVLIAGCLPQQPVVVVVTATPSGVDVQSAPTPTFTPALTDTPVPTGTPTPAATPLPPGFPTPLEGQVQVAEQPFERGRMFWIGTIRQIWVLVNGDSPNSGSWLVYDDTFVEGQPEFNPAIVPPPGLIQPIRGFGKLWRENQAVRDALGWALEPEIGYLAAYRYDAGGYIDENGVYVAGPGIHTLVNLAGQRFRFYEGTWTWELVE